MKKLYCPETMGTFKMMFGFNQPGTYRPRIEDNLKNKKNGNINKDKRRRSRTESS